MSRPSHHWKKGRAPTSLKSLNASVHNSLPKSNEAICHSLATFSRFLLGYNKTHKTYPAGPTADERCKLRPLTQSQIMSDRQIFTAQQTSIDDDTHNDPLFTFKSFCLTDLENHGIPRLTFDWNVADRDSWNRTMTIFVVEHWQYAYSQGAFDEQGITPAHNTESNCIGTMLRWVRGRSEEIRQQRRSPKKNLQKETRRKKRTLFQYRFDSLSRLLRAGNLTQQASDILPHHDCCSETEWQPENTHYPSVGLVWRSEQYVSIMHQIDKLSFKYCSSTKGARLASQRFDQCRTRATYNNEEAPVCPGLPENFYDPLFLANLTPEEKLLLKMKPASSVLNTLPIHIENFIL